MKMCSHCLKQKRNLDFHKDKTRDDKRFSWCKECFHIYYLKNRNKILKHSRKQYKNNKVLRLKQSKHYHRTHKIQERNIYLLREYGISLKEYNKLFNFQKGKCLICKQF